MADDINSLLAELLIGIGKRGNVSPGMVGSAIGQKLSQNPQEENQESANQVVAEEAEKTARKAIRGQVESLIARGVDPTRIIETTAGFGLRQTDKKGEESEAPQTSNAQPLPTQPQSPEPLQQSQETPEAQPQDKSKVGDYLQFLATRLTGIPTPGAINFVRQQRIETLRQAQELGSASNLQQKIIEAQIDVSKANAKELFKATLNAEKAGALKPENLFSAFNTAVKPFIEQRDAFNRIRASVVDPSPAGDLALVFNFMKVLDPGSTVREGEFANAQNSAGVPDRIRAQYNRLINGQRLSKGQRRDFFERSQKLFSQSKEQNDKTVKEFSDLALRNGINPSNVIRDVGIVGEEANQLGNIDEFQAAQIEALKEKFNVPLL